MATLSSLGVGSGLDAETIVTKLVAIEKQPEAAIVATNKDLSTQVSTWGKVQSTFSALQDAANALNKSTFWDATKGTSSDDSTVSVTTGASSSAGSYSISVQSLAASQYVASQAYAASTTSVGQGSIKIELGTYVSDNATPPAVTFNAKVAASAVNIPIGPGDDTLEKIRDRINSANAGVTASLVNDAAGARLVMRGPSGDSNAFKVSITEDSAAPGLSALAFDASTGGTSAMNRTQSASNAKATINGLQVSTESNTMSGVVDGLTLTLGKVTTSPVTVNVTKDTDSITKGLSDFTTAYNNVVSTIRVQSLYDPASKTGGPLQGDATARGLLSQLRSLVGSGSGASSVFGRFSDIGIDIATDGTLSSNSAKLGKALSTNGAELKKFFSNTNDTDASKNGMSQMISKLSGQLLGSDGAIKTRTDGLNATITRNKARIDSIDAKAALVEKRLRAQYTALDTSISKLNGLSTYVSAQLAALNKTA